MTTPSRKPSSRKAAPRIKNYASRADMSSIFEAIRNALATHKAKKVMFDYDDAGQAIAITFQVAVNGIPYTCQLPNRFERVKQLVKEAYRSNNDYISDERATEQAYRTSWANIRDWILAQMALIDSQMVKTEEVFFPYLLDEGGRTVYETFEQRQLLPGNISEGHYRISEEKGKS